jgi:hypothetical protein
MSTKTFAVYHELPGWAKGVVVIAGVGAVVYTGFLIRKGIKKAVDHGREQKAVNDAKADLNELQGQGMKPSYQDGVYTGWADKIEVAFSGCDWSVGQDIVGLTLTSSGKSLLEVVKQMKNDVDFLKLVAAYGTRTYDQCGTWPFSGDFTGSLYQAVSDEIDQTEIDYINKQLAAKGITKKF